MIDLSKSEKEVMSVIFTKEEEMRLKDIVDAAPVSFNEVEKVDRREIYDPKV